MNDISEGSTPPQPSKYSRAHRAGLWGRFREFKWTGKRLILLFFSAILLFELLGLAWIWPDWEALRKGKVPPSALIADYKSKREDNPKLPALQWTPLQKPLPQSIKKAFIMSEDSRFYEHGGVDFQAIQDAMEYNWKHGKILLGASTISQQTAKNMFLSLSRNPLRKFHELFLTWLLEYKLSKAEILHIYLNVAEFGIGIYGIEAAARTYYHTSAYNLSQMQAAELAASLPSPKKHNPRTRTRFFTRHVARLSRTLQFADQYASQQGKAGNTDKALLSTELAKKLQELRELNQDDGEAIADTKTEPVAETPVVSAASPESGAVTEDSDAAQPAVDIPAPDATPTAVPAPQTEEETKILE